jgi:hypothetical protein
MTRPSFPLYDLTLPPNLDPDVLPRRPTRRQMVVIHNHYFGPISLRSIEQWPLDWVIVNSHATAALEAFLAEAEHRFEAAQRRAETAKNAAD